MKSPAHSLPEIAWSCADFGAFSVKVRPARQGRNPRTGAAVAVEEKRVPFFRTGKELRERLNTNGASAPNGK